MKNVQRDEWWNKKDVRGSWRGLSGENTQVEALSSGKKERSLFRREGGKNGCG